MALFELFGRFFHRQNCQKKEETTSKDKTEKIQKRRSFLLNHEGSELEESWELIEAYNTNKEINGNPENTNGKSNLSIQNKIDFFEKISSESFRKRSDIISQSEKTSKRHSVEQISKGRSATIHLSRLSSFSYSKFEKDYQKRKQSMGPRIKFSFNFSKSSYQVEPNSNRRKSEPAKVSAVSLSIKNSFSEGNSIFYTKDNIVDPLHQHDANIDTTVDDIHQSFNNNICSDHDEREEFLLPIDSCSNKFVNSAADTQEQTGLICKTSESKDKGDCTENINFTFVKQSPYVKKLIHQAHKRSNSENKAIFSCSYLSEHEARKIKKIYHFRTFSVPNLLKDDVINGKIITQQHMAVMESLRIRKVRQKIAQRMVQVNALNVRRPRTDAGQPFNRGRSFTDHDVDIDPSILRTASDPEFLHGRSGVIEDDSLIKNDELANGDFQPIQNPPQVDDVSQPPVHSLISSYNRNSLKETDGDNKIMKPIPAPRKIKTDKSVDKPVPSPRPLTKSYSLEDIDSLSIGTDAVHFVSKKPKIRPKPSILTRQKSLDANIFHTTENKLVEKPPVGKLIDFSDSEQLKDSSETQLNSSKSYDVSPYEIVDLKSKPQEEYSISLIPEFNNSIKKNGSITLPVPLSPVLSPKSSPNSPTSPCQYIDMDRPVEEDSYLSPIEAMSPLSSPQNENSKKDLSKTPITPTNLKKKDNSNSSSSKFKFNKVKLPRKGKSLTGIQKGPLLDEKRRGSAPNIKDQKIMDCENMLYQDMGSARPVSSPSFYEPLYDIVPTEEGMADDERQEDEERWASDEFEDDEDSDEGEYTEVAQEESKPIPKLPDLDGPSRKLYNIATEILSTERAYVKRLHLLDQIFQKELVELTKEDGSITEKTIREIFANLTQIHQFHSDCFLPKFEERIFEWSTVNKIGDIFIKWGNFLRLYTVFVQNFDHSTKTISHCLKKYPKFAEVVEKIQKYPECENLSLQHHMLEPIQRVPRYKLLLNDYIKKLPADSPDKKDAEESLKNISMIAQEANNSMKENDKFKKLLDIEERISEGLKGESLVTASRIFLKEGELTKLAARKNTSSTSRTVLLFSDILLCCAVTPAGKLRVRQIMDLEGLSIEREETLPELAFRIKSRQRVLDLLPRDVTEKDDWINAINDAVNEFSTKRGSLIKRAMEEYDGKHGIDKPGQSAPVWVKDEDVTMCMLCAAKFGLIHRKHHCRGCGRVTCDSCSNYRAPLAYMSNKVSRVCYACSEKLGLQVDKTLEESEVKQSAKSRDSSLGVDISGELFWKSPSKSWNKEWIFLTQFTLYIQKKRQDVMARFTLPLPGYSVDKPSSADEIESSHPHCVKLHKNNKKEHTYYISSESKETMERWRNHLVCATKLETYQE